LEPGGWRVILKLKHDEADLLCDILADASVYHHEMLEQYESLNLSDKFEEEMNYHSKAIELCGELVWEISSLNLNKEDAE
jgi:hypothetical protein